MLSLRGIAAAASIVAAEGTALLARRDHGPDDIRPDLPGPAPSPAEQARRLRDQAIVACAAQDLATCGAKLDEARSLDPAGEAEPRVIAARKLLAPVEAPSNLPGPKPVEPQPPLEPPLEPPLKPPG